VFNLNKIN